MSLASACARPPGRLQDTAARDYAGKLRLFSRFAEPELRGLISSLGLFPGAHVLDAGCGTGEALDWLAAAVGPGGRVVGVDLAAAHVAAARLGDVAQLPAAVCGSPGAGRCVVQGDVRQAPFAAESFDLVWCVKTLHHLDDPAAGLQGLVRLLRPGGRIALGQGALLPEMYFAWDARLERLTHEAVRRYYRDRYGLDECDLAGVRGLLGLLRGARLGAVSVRSVLIERISPLRPADRAYLEEAIFRGTWGERLRPYLPPADFAALARLCDPADEAFALTRPDFHFLQSFTLACGTVPCG